MNGRVLHQEEVVRVHVASTTTATAACSTSNSGPPPPPPPRRVLLVDQRGGRIAGPLQHEAGGEFTFELIENYPSLGLSAVQDGSGTIINWRGARGAAARHHRVKRKDKDKDLLDSDSAKSPKNKSVMDPYLPAYQHLLCDLDLVASSLHLKNYPVCENDLYDVNSESCLHVFSRASLLPPRHPPPCHTVTSVAATRPSPSKSSSALGHGQRHPSAICHVPTSIIIKTHFPF